ncbi:MAG: sigma 54-interacting transcriptional regulator [Deltaproteobacteria bacterium]|nr:sigma 54-interacting transcriptional regulator [Deltaproteobacteria bacterium]
MTIADPPGIVSSSLPKVRFDSMRRIAGPGANDPTPHDPTASGPRAVGDLLLVAGNGQLSTYELSHGEVVIGRGADCDVVIDHRSLSRRHAVLRAGAPVTVEDLGSTNGTRVGGELRRGGPPIPLHAGDGFHIGPFSFVIVARMVADDRSVSGRDLLRVIDPTTTGVPALVRDIAQSAASILILGETGVGKEVLASTLHELSGRTGGFTRINCAALSESLLESELFGHEKGAFTGAGTQKIGLLEAAHQGTVFLDEIGELPLAIQAKLLRAVEHREVIRLGSTKPIAIDVRFIAATNRDLPAEVASGAFRRDLYFRLDGVTLVIPPLRERRGLIGPLALRFLEALNAKTGKPTRLGADVLGAREAYDWPGNVRELKAVIERAVLLARTGDVGVRHLAFVRASGELAAGARPEPRAAARTPTDPPPIRAASAPEPEPPGDGALAFLDDAQRADRDLLLRALDECAGNQTRAAKKLGISRTTLVTKLRLYRIPRPRT